MCMLFIYLFLLVFCPQSLEHNNWLEKSVEHSTRTTRTYFIEQILPKAFS